MIKIVNFNNKEFNICHFQGRALEGKPLLVNYLFDKKIGGTLPEDITIMTTETNPSIAITCQQLEKNNIPYVNSVKEPILEWTNIEKVGLILNALKDIKTKYCVIVDGRDVLFNTFDGLLDKFLATGYRMIYNATKNNFPRMEIDRIHERDWRGDFKYFNAGCCIGYTEDLVKFYQDCFDIKDSLQDVDIINSEQYILRSIFARYSEDVTQKVIEFDYMCDMFQSFAGTQTIKADSDTYRISGYQPLTKADFKQRMEQK